MVALACIGRAGPIGDAHGGWGVGCVVRYYSWRFTREKRFQKRETPNCAYKVWLGRSNKRSLLKEEKKGALVTG